MTNTSTLGRLNRLLKENLILHAIIAAVVVFAVRIGFDLYAGNDPAVFEAVGSGLILGVIYYSGMKYGDS